MDFTYGETITVMPGPPGTDSYGDPLPITRTGGDITGCAVAPRYSTEPTERGRQGVIVGLSIYAPTGSDILFTDLIEVRGQVYMVEGDPGDWVNPFTGWAPGMEIALKRAAG